MREKRGEKTSCPLTILVRNEKSVATAKKLGVPLPFYDSKGRQQKTPKTSDDLSNLWRESLKILEELI